MGEVVYPVVLAVVIAVEIAMLAFLLVRSRRVREQTADNIRRTEEVSRQALRMAQASSRAAALISAAYAGHVGAAVEIHVLIGQNEFLGFAARDRDVLQVVQDAGVTQRMLDEVRSKPGWSTEDKVLACLAGMSAEEIRQATVPPDRAALLSFVAMRGWSPLA